MRSISLLLVFSIMFSSCKKVPFSIETKVYNDGVVYSIKNKKGEMFEFSFQENGKLDYVSNIIYYDQIQTIYFHGNGIIKSKLMKDTLFRTNGRAYYFYDISGNLSGDYNYVNDIEFGNAVEYFDSTAIHKKSMLFNERGEIYWFQEYDKQGNVIKEEGSVPDE